ncbi:MAG: tachylectin-related carbohydrate-binding protein [Betaproteobacteria bacterium]
MTQPMVRNFAVGVAFQCVFFLVVALLVVPRAYSAATHPVFLVKPDGDLLLYEFRGAPNASNSWGPTQIKIGNGWNLRHLFSGGNGVIFGIDDKADLYYYRFLGFKSGAAQWTASSKIGNGWNFPHVLSTGDGKIFAINDAGDMLYYQFRGMNDGSNSWGKTGVKIGEGWNYPQVFGGGDGVIFAVASNGDLLYSKFYGFPLGKGARPSWGPQKVRIGNGWNSRRVFSGGDGAIFSITTDADLFFHPYLGMKDGSYSWGTDAGVKVGNGWSGTHIFADLRPGAAPPPALEAPREVALPPPENERCANYARRAVQQFQRTTELPKCRVARDMRWHDDYRSQYNWCLTAPPGKVAAEHDARDRHLLACGGTNKL